MSLSRLVLALLAVAAAAPAAPTVPARIVRVKDMAELKAALAKAGPATIIELAPGTYAGGLHQAGLKGNEAAPIRIRSAEADRPAVFTGQVQFSDPAHLVLENFVIRGSPSNGLNIDDGGTFDTPARHVILRRLRVETVGPKGNLDGIKLSGVQDFLVEGCTVRDWGSGGSAIDMVGCHRGLIVGCAFSHKDPDAASGIQAKGGSSDVVVRGCLFEQAGRRAVNLGGSTGEAYFRPPGVPFESRRIIVLGCRFRGSEAPIAFVGTEESQVLYSTILWPKKWIMRILQEKPVPPYVPCRAGTFAGNMVVWKASDVATQVNVGPGTEAKTFRFAANLWYAADAPGRSRPDLPAAETGGVYGEHPGIALSAEEPPRLPEGAMKYGAEAEGERQAWEKVARPLVPWAAAKAAGEAKR